MDGTVHPNTSKCVKLITAGNILKPGLLDPSSFREWQNSTSINLSVRVMPLSWDHGSSDGMMGNPNIVVLLHQI